MSLGKKLKPFKRLPRTIIAGENREKSIIRRQFFEREDISSRLRILSRPKWMKKKEKNEKSTNNNSPSVS